MKPTRQAECVELVLSSNNLAVAFARAMLVTASVRFVFVSAAEEAKLARQIGAECFRGKVPKARLDATLEHLLAATPPRITVQWGERADGAPLRVYRLAAE